MTTSEHIADLAAAMAKAQQALRPALKDATNPHFKSSYADLASVLEAGKVYAAQGIAFVQDVQLDGDGVAVRTRLIHASGQWLEVGPLTVPVGKRDAHGVGSATTYAKRYALQAALGMASEDDDGNQATTAAPQTTTKQPATPAGFDAWLLDLEATALDGEAALKAAWEASSPDLRAALGRERLAALKAKAAKVAA